MIVAVTAGVPCLILLALLGVRRIQSLPLARQLAVSRTGDMRGIALQTIIITVVMLAIAGAVAAVLFTRAEEETSRLQDSEDTFVYAIGSRLQCQSLGHDWQTANPNTTETADLKAALNLPANITAIEVGTGTNVNTHYLNGWCKPGS